MLYSSMAPGYTGFNLEIEEDYSESIIPLLMENPEHVHVEQNVEPQCVVPIIPSCPSVSSDEFKTPLGTSSPDLSPSQENVIISIDPPAFATGSISTRGLAGGSIRRSSSTLNRSQLIPTVGSFSRRSQPSGQLEGVSVEDTTRQRINPLSSRLWISIELAMTIAQIVSAIIVLLLSRNEKPKAPLALWIMCYTGGCVATLPLIYWRYKRRNARRDTDPLVSSSVASSSSSLQGSSHASRTGPQPMSDPADESNSTLPSAQEIQVSNGEDSRTNVCMERNKVVLDCFFAVWFVVGNVWVFASHSSSHDAPNLYRLCIVFLSFSCIGYAMPFVICATVCCCLPCIVTLLTYRDDQVQRKGAAPEVIAALPIYKFKVNNRADMKIKDRIQDLISTKSRGKNEDSVMSESKDDADSDPESVGEGGVFAPGTDRERGVSAEDAVCCICLGVYKDGVDLKELQCSHFFHVACVDEWLKINATCPLCKRELDATYGGDEH